MSGRIRACGGPAPPQTYHEDAPHPGCPECGWQIEVLLDLSDAARTLDAESRDLEPGVTYVRVDDLHAVRADLARLDGEVP